MKNTKLIFQVSALILTALTLPAEAKTCKHRIIHLPQSHSTDYAQRISVGQKDAIMESQFKIAQYIDRRPDLPVFSEQATESTISINDFSQDIQHKLLQKGASYFPNGLPENFTDLSDVQKEKLMSLGGEFIQVMRGKTKTLHSVVGSLERREKLYAPIDAWFKTVKPTTTGYPLEIAEIVYTEREREALNQIKNHLEKNPKQQDVILIYGANHDFTRHPDVFPSECVVIPDQFKKDWNPALGYVHHMAVNKKLKSESNVDSTESKNSNVTKASR